MARVDGLKNGKNEMPAGEINTNVYATQPTRFTLFMRTFLPWQLWRFLSINLKMLLLISKENRQHK